MSREVKNEIIMKRYAIELFESIRGAASRGERGDDWGLVGVYVPGVLLVLLLLRSVLF